MFILPPDLCSGRSDRLAHLPFSSCHPEEDRAGEDILTALPSGLHGATQTKTMTEPEGQREEGQKGGGRSLKTGAQLSISLSSLRSRERNAERDRSFKSSRFSISLPLFLFLKKSGEELERF